MSPTTDSHQCDGTPHFGCRGNKDVIGVLIAQLGTPDAPTPRALRKYLRQFLSDRRVIEVPRLLWLIILYGIVLTFRPKRSARLYKRIWWKEGSPLLKITEAQTARVREAIQKDHPLVAVEFGMRYGSPSLESAIDGLIAKGCTRILLFPMYPQYSATTTAATYDAVFAHLLKRRCVPTLRVAEPYYAHPAYISSLATVINEGLAKIAESDRPEKLVLSYHGIPEKYIEKGDVYCCHCTETTQALLPKLSLPQESVIHTYQSRFGRDPWLIPYTDRTIESLAHEGVKNIAICAPGFTADCLETLDELGNEGRESFHESGGGGYTTLSCLNDHPVWIEAMKSIITEELGSWLSHGGHRGCGISCPIQAAKARGLKP
jgi:ferrochelatase